MASLFLAYGLVLAAFAAALFWLILKAYRNKSADLSSADELAQCSLFEEEANVVALSAYRRADISALRLLQEYSQIETSNLSEKEKLREILVWNQKLEDFERNNRKIIQSKAFLRPVQERSATKANVTPITQL